MEKDPSLEPLSAREKKGLVHAAVASLVVTLGLVWVAGPQGTTALTVPASYTVSEVMEMDESAREALVAEADAALLEDEDAAHVVRVPSGGAVTGVLRALPGWGVLRNPDTNSLIPSPFLRSVVAFIFVFFIIPGFVYGRVVGTMQGDRDVIDAMAEAMSSMGLYIVLVFFAAQFVAFFGYTNLGQILAVVGGEWLRDMNLDNPGVFIPFILMCCFVNLMLGSASAQWAVTAPIFVPMLMSIGYSPEVIQAAYRIGDSTTNIITPMMSYFGLILAFAARYDKKLGIGTLVSTMLPYSICFLVGWIILFYLWVFVLGLPVGPGAPTYYNVG